MSPAALPDTPARRAMCLIFGIREITGRRMRVIVYEVS
jgi:hypothetical protein